VQTSVADQPSNKHELVGSASSADTDRWMVLSREEVVVTKRIVPVEQVRLEIYPVTNQQQVTADPQGTDRHRPADRLDIWTRQRLST